MAESSLNDLYMDIAGDIGVYLGWGSKPTDWDDDQFDRIKRYLKSGLRTFYFPPPIDGVQYEWSFLKPVATLSLATDEQYAALPEDFGGVTSPITVLASGSTVHQPQPLRLTLEAAIREQYAAMPTTTGRPVMAALVADIVPTLKRSNRQRMWFWPIANGDYSIQFQYQIIPEMLSGNLPYAYGGAQHAETILEACLAQAELKGDDQADGPHAMKFRERLSASIAQDRKMTAAFAGYNGDRSDAYEGGRTLNRRSYFPVQQITYNGSEI